MILIQSRKKHQKTLYGRVVKAFNFPNGRKKKVKYASQLTARVSSVARSRNPKGVNVGQQSNYLHHLCFRSCLKISVCDLL